MNLFDIVIFAIVITSLLLGLQKGLIKLTIGLICFILTIVSTYFLFPLVRAIVVEHTSNIVMVNAISVIVGYIIATIFFGFVSSQLSKLVSEMRGGLFDRLCGMIIGVLRGAVISSILFGLIAIFTSGSYTGATNAWQLVDGVKPSDYPSWFKDSRTFGILSLGISSFGMVLSRDDLEHIKLPSVKTSLPEVSSTISEYVSSAAESGNKMIPRQSSNIDDVMNELEQMLGQ
jgi:uncharacterized membrane protein required for colicin V production